MKISQIHKINRPREKLLKNGTTQKLKTSELLAIILGSGTKKLNAIELAEKILKTLKKNKPISIEELTKTNGIGPAKATKIIAALTLKTRLENIKKEKIISSHQIWKNFQAIAKSKKEYLIALYLNQENKIIKQETITKGSLKSIHIHPQEIFEPAIKNFASKIILIHNHPSGKHTPSKADIKTTNRIIKAGKILGIEILDHIIITKKNYFSFKKEKLIN